MHETPDHDTLPPSMDPAVPGGVKEPPTRFWGIMSQLGPGLIIAGSIVGSGELIGTTKTGAQAGISLLWLIIIGCLIKVFVQIELGRYTITHGETTLAALDQVPGPRARVNWIVWFWFFMMLVSLGQLGGIVGGVGQALALSFPLTGDYMAATDLPSAKELRKYVRWSDDFAAGEVEFQKLTPEEQKRIKTGHRKLQEDLDRANKNGGRGDVAIASARRLLAFEAVAAEARNEVVELSAPGGSLEDYAAAALQLRDAEDLAQGEARRLHADLEPITWDDMYWAMAATLVTIALLYGGSYGLIEKLATAMVVTFTFLTVGNVIALQYTQEWHIPSAKLLEGMLFRLPPGTTALATALATFGIIGVGANELIAYPYFCLEKGYAKFTGRRDASEAWGRRANGWMKVMHFDAWTSMIIYTVATLAFYMMGVAVLYSEGRDPEGMRMVSTLIKAYIPVFGVYAHWLFLAGAIAVLYSTFLIANAGHARVFTDGFKLFGLLDPHDQVQHKRSVSNLSVLLPLFCLGIFATRINPVTLVLLGGTMQAIMLPMLGFAALYFRYKRCDARLRPNRLWDFALGLSCLGLFIAGGWSAYEAILKIMRATSG